MIYGSSVGGLTNAGLRDLRSITAASCRVLAAASYLSAKLALGGAKWEDIDPAVHDSSAPLFAGTA